MRYLLNNIAFFVTLGVLVTAACLVKNKRALLKDFSYCALICILTFGIDFAVFFQEFMKVPASIPTLKYSWVVFTIITSNIFMLMAVTGLFTALRCIPFCGRALQWLAWVILTIPTRLYYFVTNILPSSQDLINLLSVKLDISLDTISTMLNPYSVLKACLPNIIVIAIVLIFRFSDKHERRRASSFIMGVLIFAAYCVNPKGEFLLRDSMGHSLKVLRETAMNFSYYFTPRDKFVYETAQTNPQNNIVFILDESIRGDYLTRETTPRLYDYIHDYPADIFDYGLMMSTATITGSSRIALMTGVSHIPDHNLDSYRHPTIFDIAKANGYKTILINLQGDFPDLTFRESDMKNADEVYLSDKAFNSYSNNMDFNAACYVRERLINEKGLFIFLEKLGAHVPYTKRYPVNDSEHNIFTPCLEPNEWYTLEKRQKVVNSYKNVLRYNIDGFFLRLFGDNPEELHDCTIIYTSDHGQSFMEYGQVESHGSGYFEQAIVPFIIFSTDTWVLENLKRPEQITFTLHHMNIAPTIQSIMCKDLNHSSGKYDSLVTARNVRKPPLIYMKKGLPWDCEVSDQAKTDENGKIILPVEKYLY